MLVPLWETADIGVCGGVVSGRVGGCDECVAVTNGTDPSVGVGLLTTDPVACCTAVDCVAIEDTELDRAGLAGGIGGIGVALPGAIPGLGFAGFGT